MLRGEMPSVRNVLVVGGGTMASQTALSGHRVGEGPEPSATLREKVERGELGRTTGRGFYDYGEGK
jgi:hypothetical protein